MSSRQRGSAIVAVLLILALIGVAAVVIDIGYARVVRTQLQAATDAGAHAGAAFIDGTSTGLTTAKTQAQTLAAANEANGASVSLSTTGNDPATSDIVTGVWDGDTFTASSTAADVNAIQVTADIPNLSTSFAKVAFGQNSLAVQARSIGLRMPEEAASAVDCYIPIAIPKCELERHPAGTIPSITFEFSSAQTDNSAWASLVAHPNASTIRSQLRNCLTEGEAAEDDTVYVNNGQITAALSELGNQISNSTTRWDTSVLGPIPARMNRSAISASNYGKTFEGPILVLDEEGQECSSIQFVQDFPLAGFAWGVIWDVSTNGSDKDIRMRINNTVTESYGTAGGGEVNSGVTYQPPPRLVF